MPLCDGCSAQAQDAHIRRRIERLELATRFRPVHIQVLVLDVAPPLRMEDYFYRPASDRSARSVAARMYFDELAKCAGHASGTVTDEESALLNFQRRGFFLAWAVECPLEEAGEGALNRLGPTVVKRIQASYKPKLIAPVGPAMKDLIPLLELSGLQDRLVLSDRGPFVDPFLGDPQNQAEFDTGISGQLSRALAGRV